MWDKRPSIFRTEDPKYLICQGVWFWPMRILGFIPPQFFNDVENVGSLECPLFYESFFSSRWWDGITRRMCVWIENEEGRSVVGGEWSHSIQRVRTAGVADGERFWGVGVCSQVIWLPLGEILYRFGRDTPWGWDYYTVCG